MAHSFIGSMDLTSDSFPCTITLSINGAHVPLITFNSINDITDADIEKLRQYDGGIAALQSFLLKTFKQQINLA